MNPINIGMGFAQGISGLGTALHLPGMGLSEPMGTPYNPQRTAQSVYQPYWQQQQHPQGQVQGASTYQSPSSPPISSAGNPGYGSPQGGGQQSPQYQSGGQQYVQQIQNANQGVAQSQIQAAQNYYNQMQQQIQAQQQPLTDAFNQGNAGIDTAAQQSQGQANAQEGTLQTNANSALSQSQQQYQDAQAQNRNLARSLGSFGSDYAGLQNRTSNSFGTTNAGITNDLTSHMNEIESNKTAMMQQAQQQKSQLQSQYQQALKQISLNIDATEFQKADAINKIQSAYQGQLGQINQSLLSFQQQSQLMQQQIQSYAALYGKSGGTNFAGMLPQSYAPAVATAGSGLNMGQSTIGLQNTNPNQQQQQQQF